MARRNLVLDNMLRAGHDRRGASTAARATGTPLPTRGSRSSRPRSIPSSPTSRRGSPSSWWTVRRGRDLRRRREDQDDAGSRSLQDDGRGRRSRIAARPDSGRARRWSRSTTAPARSARWSAATDYNTRPVQPRHQRPPPARLGDQAVHADRRARERPRPRRRSSPPRRSTLPDPDTKGGFEVHNYEGSYTGVTTLRKRDPLGQLVFAELGVSTGTKKIAASPAHGHPDPALDEPRHDAGRSGAGRDPARDGLRLRDDRQRRSARSGSCFALLRGGPVAIQGLLADRQADPTTPSDADRINQRREPADLPRLGGRTTLETDAGVVEDGTAQAAQVVELRLGQDGHDRELR